ncbi:winged helix DNA-binding protein [Sphingomonas sp. KR3-1]|uniref:winged helix DNA-binding protein n=1 Tax=Sphingomonas sp. KR3-1 TaxID=3156611 RepID=UPI0032B5D963
MPDSPERDEDDALFRAARDLVAGEQPDGLQAEHLDRAIARGGISALDRARALYDLRRSREHFFKGNADLFGEPAWDILLDLFIAGEMGKQVSVTSACIGANTPPTTALRWLSLLEERGLVQRIPDLHDRRRALMRLTPKGDQSLRAYLETC